MAIALGYVQSSRGRWSALWRAAFFTLVGLFVAFVGAVDAVSARLVEYRFGGLLLLVAGGAVVGASVLTVLTPYRWLGVGSGLITVLMAVVFGVAAFEDADIERRSLYFLIAASVVAAIALWAVFESIRYDDPSPPFKTTTVKIELVVAVVALAGSIVAAWLQLMGNWYTSRYLPTHQRSNLSTVVDIGEAVTQNGVQVVPIEIRIRNGGGIALHVFLSYYEVHGVRVRAAKTDPGPESLAAPFLDEGLSVPAKRFSRFRAEMAADLVQYGRITEDVTNLAPSEEKSTRVLVVLPKRSAKYNFDGLRVLTIIAAAKDDDIDLEDPLAPPQQLPPRPSSTDVLAWEALSDEEQDIYTAYAIKRSTFFRRLVSAERQVKIGWLVRCGERRSAADGSRRASCPYFTTAAEGGVPDYPVPYVEFGYQSDAREPRQYADVQQALYDPFWVRSIAERSFAEKDGSEDERSGTASSG